jgi:pimeloyl-ACP methyl ester carboxylesterase
MKKGIVLIVLLGIIFLGIFQIFFYEEPLPKSSYVDLENGYLAYDEYGSSEKILILIHGSPGEKKTFEEFSSHIFGFKIYALDMFCFGESTKELDDCGMEFAADTILEFMDVKGIETASLLGYSWGGSVVITFAHNYPERLDNLILLSGNGIQDGEPTKHFFSERARSWLAYPFVVYYPGAFAGDYRWRRGFIKSFVDSDQRKIENWLGEISTRTLILHGYSDTIILPFVAEKHNSLLENSELEFFHGDHMAIFRDFDEIVEKLSRFLENE